MATANTKAQSGYFCWNTSKASSGGVGTPSDWSKAKGNNVGTNTSITISTISNESWWTSPDFTVVLPACGYSPYSNGSDQAAGWSSATYPANGYYWSAAARDASSVHYMYFNTSSVRGNGWGRPGYGFSVRLFADK